MTKKREEGNKNTQPVVVHKEPEILGTMTGTESLHEGGIPRTCSKVAIVGFAPSSMEDAQFLFGDPDCEIWAINQLYIAWPRIVPANRIPERRNVTRWFQIHHRHSYDQTVARDHSHHEWMQQQTDFPIYMQVKEPDIPCSVAFPKDQLLKKFRRYFTNSISWEIALAIYEGFKKVYIFGVDMAQDCLVPETKVLTTDLRWVKIGDVKVGDNLLGFDEYPEVIGLGGKSWAGERRKWKSSEVLEANVLTRPCYRVHFEDGTSIVASAGHQWLAKVSQGAKWRRTDELITPYHRFPTRIIKPLDVWEDDLSYDGGYLAAALDGEGCLGQYDYEGTSGNMFALTFVQKQNPMLDRVSEILIDRGFDWTKKEKNGGANSCSILGGRLELLRLLGTTRPCRLLEKFDPDMLGRFRWRNEYAVTKLEYVGEQTVIGLKTSTKTFIAEGFASHNSEYSFERPSVEYFCGYAEGAGIELVIPEKSDLLKAMWLYPFEQDAPMKVKIEARRVELRNRVQNCGMNEQSLHDERMQLLGALDNMNYVERTWVSNIKDQALWEGK